MRDEHLRGQGHEEAGEKLGREDGRGGEQQDLGEGRRGKLKKNGQLEQFLWKQRFWLRQHAKTGKAEFVKNDEDKVHLILRTILENIYMETFSYIHTVPKRRQYVKAKKCFPRWKKT